MGDPASISTTPKIRPRQVDMNVVMTGTGKLVEVQGTAEQGTFERTELDLLLDLATKGIAELTAAQEKALGAPDQE